MKLEKAISRFMIKWVNNMKKLAPVGKRPRTEAASKLYAQGLKKSIKFRKLQSKPVITMNLYGKFVNDGHRTRGVTKLGPNPSPDGFISPAWEATTKNMEEKLPDEVFQILDDKFGEVLKKYRQIG